MSLARKSSITAAWVALAAVTVGSVATAELLGNRILAVIVIMAIAATKGAIILRRFMDVETAPAAIRYYLAGWTAVCAAMIVVLFGVASG